MNIFLALSLIIVLATVLAAVAKFFKQPLIVAYILTGLIVSPLIHMDPAATHTFEVFSEMGIAILLFIVGLHLSPEEASDFGVNSLKVAVGQVIFTGALGFVLAMILGYSLVPALYIATALTFSSTIIVLKLLADKQELEKLYGKVSIAILLVQDIVAALALIVVSSFAAEKVTFITVISPLLKGILAGGLVFLVAKKVLPKLTDFFAKSTELLFLFALAWGFGLAALFSLLGLSMEIGALIAGVALSMSPYAAEMSGKLRPLRDFFVVMFFIFIGSRIDLSLFGQIWIPLIVFSFFILALKPLIILFLMGGIGYKKKTSFMTSSSLLQISEFSLILGVLGVKLGHIDHNLLSLLTLLGVISIGISSYIIEHADKLYAKLGPKLSFMEKFARIEETETLLNYEVVLFGCNRVGYDFIEEFKDLGSEFLCVDYDPDLVARLQESGVNCRYGDAEDSDFIAELGLDKAKMVISTIPDFEANMFLLQSVKHVPDVIVIVLTYDVEHALRLYEHGADYVIFPHFIGGRLAADLVDEAGYDIERFAREKDEHIEYLKERKKLGHTHSGNLSRFNI